jgi:kynurenine formamidase
MTADLVDVPEPHNWRRWGSEDERGTLNLLTPAVVRQALGSVRQGRVLGLAMPIRGSTSGPAPLTVPHLPGRPLPQHFMSVDGGDYAAGARAVGNGLRLSDDALIVSPHGTTTHLDALCHAWYGERMYNNQDGNRVRSYGALRCGIEKVGGIVTRGVLLDVASHLGVNRLDGEVRISAGTLAQCADATGVQLRPGDVALIRTGWPTMYAESRERYYHPQPGLSYDGGVWLAERDVAVVAMDNTGIAGLDHQGRFAEPPEEDLHLLFLWRHGIHLLEMLWLEELAEQISQRGSAHFLFVIAPLAVEGGTASPVQPLAVL